MCIPSIGTMDSVPSRPVFYDSVNSSYPWKQMVTVMHFCFYDASGLNESQYLPTGAEFQLLQYTGQIKLFGFCDVRLISFYLIYAVNLYILISE